MLNLIFDSIEGELVSGDGYFDSWFDEDNLETEFAKRVVKEIDNSELVSKYLVISPVLGSIPVSMISGGAKSLLILMFCDKVISLSAFGENCYKLLLYVSKLKNITITMDSYKNLFAYGELDCIHILNDDSYVKNEEEFRKAYFKFR